jgi:hypothetical protein
MDLVGRRETTSAVDYKVTAALVRIGVFRDACLLP